MDRDRLTASLKQHEGLRLSPYVDTVGKITIGYGHNLSDNPISEYEAENWLNNDIAKAAVAAIGLMPIAVWNSIGDVRRNVVTEMCFNLGGAGVAKFYHFLAAVHDSRWEDAAAEMLNSRWGGQVHARATELAEMMRTGEWPQ